ncbi:hypothetical protein DPX16_22090 [Anabarilius grahami]|uniref:Uncharacterized protein n=1 Tax=Anabarilius grahami TaxID=495550 RepID=A0A3N0XP57_ANAGA|nr:hypothetical protein DPX16_22090 [Anabarilius grahami]
MDISDLKRTTGIRKRSEKLRTKTSGSVAQRRKTNLCGLWNYFRRRNRAKQKIRCIKYKSEAVPLTDRWSPQLTDRAMCFMFSGRPVPAAAPAQGAARRGGSHFEGRCDTSSRRGTDGQR